MVNNQERLSTSQEKTAVSRPHTGATDCKEVLKKKRGEKKEAGEERKAEWDHHEFGKNEAHPLGR